MTFEMPEDPVLLDVPVPITTPRLILRPAQAGDGAKMARAIDANWDDLARWMPWARDRAVETDPVKKEAMARRAYAKFLLREDFMMLGFERESGALAVFTGLHRFDWEYRIFDIGYWVHRDLRGQGLAGETANALTRFAFSQLGANKVCINHVEGNAPSARVIEKLGFTKEGVQANAGMVGDGSLCDSHVYGMLSPDPLPDLNVSWGDSRG